MNESAFDNWYNGIIGFHINSERIIDDLNIERKLEAAKLRQWMIVCWNTALGEAELVTDLSLRQLKEKT